MTYVINGTELSLQPTTGRWSNREYIGIDGNGHAIYAGKREFEMRWGFMTAAEFNELQGLYDALGNTGTATVSLPEYGATPYAFREYSGTVLREPEVGEYFETYVSDVRLLILKISSS